MKHQVNSIVIIIFLLMIFITCDDRKQHVISSSKICNQNAQGAIFNFIKAITTSDSALFYSTVNTDSIVVSFEQQKKYYPDDNVDISNITKENVYKIFFLKYSPWKILPKNLKRMREKNFTAKNYIIAVEEEQKDYCRIKLNWQMTEDSDTNYLNLKMRIINSEWKVVYALPQ